MRDWQIGLVVLVFVVVLLLWANAARHRRNPWSALVGRNVGWGEALVLRLPYGKWSAVVLQHPYMPEGYALLIAEANLAIRPLLFTTFRLDDGWAEVPRPLDASAIYSNTIA